MTAAVIDLNERMSMLLEKRQLVPRDVIRQLVTRANTLQEWVGQVAVDDGILSGDELARILSQDLGIAYVDLTHAIPDPVALQYLPEETCRAHMVVPLGVQQDGLLELAVANPLDSALETMLPTLAGCPLALRVAPLEAVARILDVWYAGGGSGVGDRPAKRRPTMVERVRTVARESAPAEETFATPISGETQDLGLDQLLGIMMESRASDLHLTVGSPPLMRVHGELRPMGFPPLSPQLTREIIYAVLTDVQITIFEQNWELDFAYSVPGLSRFRVNVFRQRGSLGAILRAIPTEVPTLDKLKMPPIVRELTMRPRGLVLVTGPTGSGKSTTLAAMLNEINSTRRMHIITIEDPIEFLHRNKMSEVNQREVGADTQSFSIALRHVLRQDPDVILIGEMRDLETISAAVTAAETGHLVFATLHTTSAAQTIDRVIDVFPPHQQEQIRSQLSNTLEGILTQTLVPNIDGRGRSCAQEILMATPAIRNLIREGKVHQMTSVIQASAKYGMQTLDAALKQLVVTRQVSLEEALLKSTNPEDFKAFVAMR